MDPHQSGEGSPLLEAEQEMWGAGRKARGVVWPVPPTGMGASS